MNNTTINKFFSIAAAFLMFVMTSCAPQEVKPPPKPAKIAVVLGAGASKGFAHIGVLKVLESNKIPIHMIVGTSAEVLLAASMLMVTMPSSLKRCPFP